MAESLDDGEFWLLPKFLTEDDVLTDMSSNPNNKKDAFDSEAEAEATNKALFPFEFSYGFGSFGHSSSDLSSPVESVMSSTEAESDEEDFMAGLTRQMAHSTLEEEDFARSHKTKGGFVTGSPQSTLCTVRSGCSRTQGSSRGSPNCQSQVSSPPGTWDLLYAAAGKVERIRMNQESYGGYNHNSGLLGPARKPSPVSVPPKNHNANPVDFGFYNSQYQHHHQNQQSLSHQKLQASQLHHLKHQQRLKQQQGSSVWGGSQSRDKATTGFYQVGLNRVNSTNSPRPLGLSPSAWPPLQLAQQPQQQNGSGMRAMFLGAPNGKRECTGTGVFLPRRVNTPTETRKKPACSTVLLPAKVVQALNLNFDELGSPFQPRFGSYAPDTGATVRYRNGYQKRILRQQQGANHEIRLPQEWTY